MGIYTYIYIYTLYKRTNPSFWTRPVSWLAVKLPNVMLSSGRTAWVTGTGATNSCSGCQLILVIPDGNWVNICVVTNQYMYIMYIYNVYIYRCAYMTTYIDIKLTIDYIHYTSIIYPSLPIVDIHLTNCP